MTEQKPGVPLDKSEGAVKGKLVLCSAYVFFLFPFQNVGAPSLRFFQGWAAMLLIAQCSSCLATCIDITVPTTCTLSRVLVIAACRVCAPHGAATDYSPC